MLNLLVADEYVLYATTRDFQWNVSGPISHRLQEQFEWQAEHIAGWIDYVAERIRSIGLGVRGHWAELATSARAAAESGIGLPAEHMLAQLITLHEDLMDQLRFDCETCREQFLDKQTADILAGILAQHANAAGKLRTLLVTALEEPSQHRELKTQNSNS